MNSEKENTSFVAQNVITAIQRWHQLINHIGEAEKIANYLHPQIPDSDQNKASAIRITKSDYQQWIHNLSSLYQNASSIYAYLGINTSNQLEFYFMDSYSVNLPPSKNSDVLSHKVPILKRTLKDVSTIESRTPSGYNPPNEISYTQAQRRRNNWEKGYEEWVNKKIKKNNIVRLFTIPKNDFDSAFNDVDSIYLYFGITPDFRPNLADEKIELIISNCPPPPLTSQHLVTIGPQHYYNITTPYPPF